MKKVRNWILLAGALLTPLTQAGCLSLLNPVGMGFATPIPVFPWVTERMEDKYCWKNDFRTPIMPPIREGFPPPLCLDPPDDAMVLRAISRVKRGVPYVAEEFRDNIRVVSTLLVDRIDPPRFFPLVGPAQLHHCHWKSIVYYDQTVESGYPFPFKCVKPRIEVVYIDKDHMHVYPGCNDPNATLSMTRDTAGPF
jgi:hypothetical protein